MAEEAYETAALAVEEPEAATRRRLLAEIAACRADLAWGRARDRPRPSWRARDFCARPKALSLS